MLKMDTFCDNLANLLQNPEKYLRPDEDLYKSWVSQAALFYNGLKTEENLYGLPAPGEALPELYTDGLDMEQIWQQIELQNNCLLAAPDDLTSLDDVNIPYCVVKLNSRVKYDSLNNNIKDGDPLGKEGVDDSASEMDDDEADENKEDEEVGDDMEDENEEDDDIDMDLENKEKKPQDSLLNGDEFGELDSSDFDEDHYDDLAPEGQEDEDSDDEDNDDDDKDEENVDNIEDDHHKDDEGDDDDDDDDDDEEEINEMKKTLAKDKNKMDTLNKPDRFKSTNVDDKFFNLRESEWVADNDVLGDQLEGNFGDIDFMEDITDDEEDAGAAMYNTFFDSIEKKKNIVKNNNEEKKNQSENDNVNPEDNEIKNKDSKEEESDDEDMEEGVTKLLGGNKKETKSTFEREQEKERQIIESLEDEQMSEKPWFLKGEVQSLDRPENSTLEEHLDYDIAAKQKPVITEDTTALVEKLILNRIRTQAYDDVERKIKPETNPFEYKKKLLLDQEKNKKNLAEIYEEEYIKNQKEAADDEEEPKEHTEIKNMMDSLFVKLDALANYHYMPKHRKAEVKIVSNLPAVTMEESSPATATDASLLAPQEVLAPVRGELIASGERTDTNKKRDRRIKKAKQKAKSKEQEKKLAEKLKKVEGVEGKKLDIKTSAKVVQKAVKAGQVKLLSNNQGSKQIKSSQSFFKQLQDDVSSQINKKKSPNIEKKKKKETSQTTASKIML